MRCLGDNTIVAFAEGSLTSEEMRRVEVHAGGCAACQERLVMAVGRSVARHAVAGTRAGTGEADRPHTGVQGLSRGTSIGRYTILSLVGRGGMGDVYAAYDPELDRKVALKLLRTDGDATSGDARLLREAKAMAKIAHPNVVSVHDAGAFGPSVFVAMDFVDGSTMRDWLAARSRTRDEVVAVFIEAAHGLMAAHAAGLVHRDFKPGNVMIARDGSVRVTDFGLARTLGDAEAAGERNVKPGGTGDLSATLTATGQLLGTPRYMAPEQFKVEPTDSRTDQFGFCVALYEALYGVHPFGDGISLSALAKTVLAGRVQPAPPRSTVPTWLRRVLLRGLSVDAGARWPSMHDLVTALGRDPMRARRSWALAAGATLMVAATTLIVARGQDQPASLCRGGPERLAGIWEGGTAAGSNHSRRTVVERALLASGAPGAREVWDRVAMRLDGYAGAWLAAYRDACEATHLRGGQPAAILDLRMTCLEERRTSLAALMDVFATGERSVVASAIAAVNALPGLDRCSDLGALQAAVDPPRDVATRARVEELRRRAAVAKALNDTGKRAEGIATMRVLIADARRLDYRPVLAEMLAMLTAFESGTTFSEASTRAGEEAVATAFGAGRDDLAATASVQLTAMTGYLQADPVAGAYWARLAHALLARRGGGPGIDAAWLLTNEGMMALGQGRLNDALEKLQRSVALKEQLLPPDHPDIAIGLNSVAETLSRLGRMEEAAKVGERALRIVTIAHGPSSPDACTLLSNHAEHLLALGHPAQAEGAFRDAFTRWEAQVDAESAVLAYPLTGLGRARLDLGRPTEAVSPLERALRIREAHEPDESLVAETRFTLARALWDAHADRGRARTLAERAREDYIGVHDRTHEATIDVWLGSHTVRDAQHMTRHAR